MAMKNKTITISTEIPGTATIDTDGFPSKEGTVISKKIFADVKSVGFTEFYEGLKDGIKASQIFKVNMHEFLLTYTSGQTVTAYQPTKITFDGTDYRIVRQYRRGYGFLEVTCEEMER